MNMIKKTIPKVVIVPPTEEFNKDVQLVQQTILHVLYKYLPLIKPFALTDSYRISPFVEKLRDDEIIDAGNFKTLMALSDYFVDLLTTSGVSTATAVVHESTFRVDIRHEGRIVMALKLETIAVTVSEDFDGCLVHYENIDTYHKLYNL